jgi:hypothetical protein
MSYTTKKKKHADKKEMNEPIEAIEFQPANASG